MSGGSVPPYREPCGALKRYRGCCNQQGLTPELADKYVRTTAVPNWDTGVGGTIPPYQSPNNIGLPTCAPAPTCDASHPPCNNPWLKPYPGNTFAHTPGDEVDFALANKHGFKAVQGARTWHGTFPWINSCSGCNTRLCSDGTGRRDYQASPEQTKYLVCTFVAALHANRDGGSLWSVDATASGARTVNAQTGEVTSTLSTSETDKHAPDGGGDPVVTKNVTDGADSVTGAPSGQSTLLDTPIATDFHCGYPIVPQTPDPSAFPSDGGDKNLLEMLDDWNSTQGTVAFSTTFPAATDPNNYDQTVNMGNGLALIGTFRIAWSRTATVFSWTVEGSYTNGSDSQSYSFTGTITLSSTNTATDVENDIFFNLLVTWPLNDDKLYPWRTDLKTGIAPLVTRNEVPGIASPLGFNPFTIDDLRSPINDASGNVPFSAGWTPTFTQIDWLDGNAWAFTFADGFQVAAGGSLPGTSAATGLVHLVDGSIIGAPLPAGYQNFFNFGFSEQRGCCDDLGDSGQFWQWYTFGYGQDVETFNGLTGCQLPLNATQWNNWFEAVNKPPGAWIFYADQRTDYVPPGCATALAGSGDSGQVVVQKWAEITEGWPSQNFERPASDDKFLYDETTVYCSTNVSGSGAGSVWGLINPTTGLAPASFDTSLIWGGASVGGFYSGCTWDGTNVTLGTKEYDVPSNWHSRSNGDDASCFGPLRFPSVASLLGRIAVTASGATITFASAQPAFGMNSSTHQETVDLHDANMTLLAGSVVATRVDDSNFTISSPVASVAFVTIAGVKYYFDDNRPKGDYLVLFWTSDFRNSIHRPSEYTRLSGAMDCDGTTAMALPSSITYPNADGLGNDATVPFPANGYSQFIQQAGCLPLLPCAPRVVCISPNGETFPNGHTWAFPASVPLDEQYGSKWWGHVQQTMTDLFWQAPHRPCNIGNCDNWKQADPSYCAPNPAGNECPTVTDLFYEFPPQVEARMDLPSNYGLAKNETPPALPSGIQIGWLSPVSNAAGEIALPPAAPLPSTILGIPNDVSTAWNTHALLCGNITCAFFDYSATQQC